MGQERGWHVAGRAVMFVVFSAALLGVAARYLGRVPNGALLVGVSTAIATLLLTVASTRMERLRLQEVGASYTRESLRPVCDSLCSRSYATVCARRDRHAVERAAI